MSQTDVFVGADSECFRKSRAKMLLSNVISEKLVWSRDRKYFLSLLLLIVIMSFDDIEHANRFSYGGGFH